MNAGKLVFYLAILTLFIAPVFAQFEPPTERLSSDVKEFVSKTTSIPEKYLGFPNFIYYIAAPFFAITVLLFGLLNQIGIFRNAEKINIMLSLAASIMLIPTGLLWSLVSFLLLGGAVMAIGTVIVLYVLGGAMFAHSRGSRNLGYFKFGKNIKNIDKEMIHADQVILQNDNKIQSLQREMEHERKLMEEERAKPIVDGDIFNKHKTKIEDIEKEIKIIEQDSQRYREMKAKLELQRKSAETNMNRSMSSNHTSAA